MTFNVVLLGPAGAGKGTLAAALRERYGFAVFETGAHLRAYAAAHDPALAERLGQGNMAPTPLVMQILAEATATRPPGAPGWLLDGIPRNREQATLFVERLRNRSLSVGRILVLTAPEPVLRQRLMGRSTCARCQTIYHATTKPSPAPGRCTAACGGTLVVRDDDTEQGITQRLALYANETAPGIELLRQAGFPPTLIAATGSREAILARVASVLEGPTLQPLTPSRLLPPPARRRAIAR